MAFGQFAATSQFYLYGRQYCTSVGYEKNMKKYFKATKKPDLLQDESLSLAGKVCMVTGANSGVGFEVAQFLARKGAAKVVMVCRSKARADTAREAIIKSTGCPPECVVVLVCDLSLESEVRKAWKEFSDMQAAGTSAGAAAEGTAKEAGGGGAGGGGGLPRLDVLVCNAGVLLNEKTLTSEGVETTFACHFLFGTFLLGQLAMPALEATADSRVVVVSSGGMYNTKFPEFLVAANRKDDSYDGNLTYAYCKRGQVLLCEKWAESHPTVKFVTCHPGWTLTPAVDAAYGEQKKYLEPLRSPWQGADGIAWLCVCPPAELEQGAFYLDRVPRTKHIAGPFFTEGSFTKNTPQEVNEMMRCLALWSSEKTRPALLPEGEAAAEAAARKKPLTESSTPIEIEKFMGRWFVLASQGTYFEQDMMNCIEDYSWNAKEERIEVVFSMQKDTGSPSTVLQQRAAITNKDTNTRWAITPKLGGLFLPLSFTYLVAECAEDYSTTIITVPDRSYVWIMARTPTVEPAVLAGLLDKAARLGYDPSKIAIVAHDYSSSSSAVVKQEDDDEAAAASTTPRAAAAEVGAGVAGGTSGGGGADGGGGGSSVGQPPSAEALVRVSEAASAAEAAALEANEKQEEEGA
jgi:dehydrogenase/reductase SDR family protein 12